MGLFIYHEYKKVFCTLNVAHIPPHICCTLRFPTAYKQKVLKLASYGLRCNYNRSICNIILF